MKNYLAFFALASLFLTNCINQNPQHVVLKGHILNAPSDTLLVYDNFDNYQKVILLDKYNNFNDTLNIGTAEYYFKIGEESTNLFLSPGDDMEITLDYLSFDETIKASGKGQRINNYLFKRFLNREKTIYKDKSFFDKDSTQFYHDLNTFFDKEIHALERLHLDSHIFADEIEGIDIIKKDFSYYYKNRQELKQLALLKKAPAFRLNDIKGESVSLSDFKGKVVLIDVWATWCKPCLDEIPDLKALAEDYDESNLRLIGVSIDRQEDKELWKLKVDDEGLPGTQLILENGWQSAFKFDYIVSSIPRFILIDEEGKFIDVNAPRPSEGNKLRLLIDEHL